MSVPEDLRIHWLASTVILKSLRHGYEPRSHLAVLRALAEMCTPESSLHYELLYVIFYGFNIFFLLLDILITGNVRHFEMVS